MAPKAILCDLDGTVWDSFPWYAMVLAKATSRSADSLLSEHEAREPRRALAIARDALAELRRANQVGTIAAATYRRTKARFEHRLARLERKAVRNPGR